MKNKWTLLALLCATFVVYTIDRALLGALAIPIQSDTGMGDVQFGVLNSAVFWAYAAAVPVAGFMGDRCNKAVVIGVASVVWSVMTIIAGTASGFWGLLALVAFAITVPQTFYSPAAAGLIASRHVETRGIAMSLHQAAFYVGWMLSGIVVAAVLSAGGSWRSAYFLFGTVGLLLGGVFLLLTMRGESGAPVAKTPQKPRLSESLNAFFCCPSAVLAALGHVAFTFATFGYCAWGPKFVAEKFAVAPGTASSGVMFCHFAAAFATICVAGAVTDRFVRIWPRFRLLLQIAALVAAAPSFVMFGKCASLLGTWCAAACLGVAKGAFEANSVNSVFDVVDARFHASAMGYVNVLSGVLGSFAPMLLGCMSQSSGTHGLENGFVLLGAVLVVAAALMAVSLLITFRRDRLLVGTLVVFAFSLPAMSAVPTPEEMMGPFPIMSVAYHEDGSLDYETLGKEAQYVDDCGCPGVIWGQSNDAVDLLTREEKRLAVEAVAKAVEGRSIVLAIGVNGTNALEMLELAAEAEDVAARHPRSKIALIARPPDDVRTERELEEAWDALGDVAKRPVIFQTFGTHETPTPSVGMMVRLAKKHPLQFGYIKEEAAGNEANERMILENAARPDIKTVMSGWGGWQWLYQMRQCGSEGLITERCAYASILSAIWRSHLSGDSDGRLAQGYAMYRLLIDQRNFPGKGGLRGYNLYMLQKAGVFKNLVSREYKVLNVTEGGNFGVGREWELSTLDIPERQRRELDCLYADMMHFLGKGEKR